MPRMTKSHSYCNRCQYNGKADEHCIECARDYPNAPDTVNLCHASISIDSINDSGHELKSPETIPLDEYDERYDKIKLFCVWLKTWKPKDWPVIVDWTLNGGEDVKELAKILGVTPMTIWNRNKASKQNMEIAKISKRNSN